MNTIITIETIEALKRGEHKAFDAVFVAYFEKVKRFITGIIKSESEAEELAQDVFVKLWENHESLDTRYSFNSFIYTVARNTTCNFLKHKLIQTPYMEEPVQTEVYASPEELMFAKEIELLIEMALCQMPEQRRAIYQLSRNKGLTNEEIASLLNLSKKTVENNISLVLKEIRKIISLSLLFFA
ncbi:RNA polymerase sigma-70 factor [Bacteroidia bacterium]|nr:RNA polymerase sigma-70 factor [Bacteroidia bacterium]